MSKRSRHHEEMWQARNEWSVAIGRARAGLGGAMPADRVLTRPPDARLDELRKALRSAVGETVFEHYRLQSLQYFVSLVTSERALLGEEVQHAAGLLEGLREQNWLFQFDRAECGLVEAAIGQALARRSDEFLGAVERCAGRRQDDGPAWSDWPLSYLKSVCR